MPQIQYLPVGGLKLDLHNYRIPPAASETKSVHALIAMKPHYFWDLTRSLLESGYDGTENIIVLEKDKSDRTVHEGNRRIGAMKLILGLLPRSKFEIPPDVENSIAAITAKWKTDNEIVPCIVYPESEADVVNRLVARTHARGETAGRLKWESVARARYDRDQPNGSEPALELLDVYLKEARNLSEDEREKWGGTFPVTILHEAMQKVATRYNLGVAANVAKEQSLVYCDPPYFHQGHRLYLSRYDAADHERLAAVIQDQLPRPWVVSYDGADEILGFYGDRRLFLYDLQYNAQRVHKGKEVFIFADTLQLPDTSSVRAINQVMQAAAA